MIKRLVLFIVIITSLIACKDESKRLAENERDQKKKQDVYNTIQKAWHFDAQPLNETSQSLVSDWTEWRDLLN